VRCSIFFLAATGVVATQAVAARPHYIDARLVTESDAPRRGGSVLIGLQMRPKPGWHGYWSNPGESGLAPVVKWTAPRGVHFGPLQHPAPTLMRVMGMTSYVHAGPHVLLTRVAIDRKLRAGTVLPIVADVTWAACSDRLCVPEKARLSLRLRVGNGSPSAEAVLIRRARAHLPKNAPPGVFAVRAGEIRLTLPPTLRLKPARTRFFPDENGYWDASRSRVLSSKPLTIAGPAKGNPPRRISGIVSDGSLAYRISFVRK
jgi:DsbC/DsbD-like thiol-disulfide interchange protein